MTGGGRWIYDLETDGLLDTVSVIHCIALRNVETGEGMLYGPGEIQMALNILQNADEIIAHNGIAYDNEVIRMLHPEINLDNVKVTDTLVLSRLIRANLMQEDASSVFLLKELPKKYMGSHSLAAWGYRTGNHKGDYDGGWETYSEEMGNYCLQDTSVTLTIYNQFMKAGFSQESIDLEHDLAEICLEIGNNGWTFDIKAASELYAKLAQRRDELGTELDDLFPPWTIETEFLPKVNNAKLGYVKGEVFIKKKVVSFNPASRQHIHKCLVDKYKWKPKEFSASGQAKIDDVVLSELPFPEAKRLAEYFLIQKRIGMLAEGAGAWLKMVDDDGKIRHTIVSGATISGRAAHRGPNLGQVPGTNSPYGKECRSLFTVPKDWHLIGSDLSGLELRCLAHNLNDNGEYAKQILDGDIHSYNAKAFGVDRPTAKTAIYSMIFGAGNPRLGAVVGGGAKEGAKLKDAYDKAVPAFAELKRNLARAAKRGYLKGIDGRHLYLRSERNALSQLLQGSGAIICKKWVQLIHKELKQKYGRDAQIIAWVHDEVQIACRTLEISHDVQTITERLAKQSGIAFQTKIPIDSEHSAPSRTWADTH